MANYTKIDETRWEMRRAYLPAPDRAPPRPKKRVQNREPGGPEPTLGSTQGGHCGSWIWLDCPRCGHHVPTPMAPYVIRWGADTPISTLRRNARCTVCGHKGMLTMARSWTTTEGGWQKFPTGYISRAMMRAIKTRAWG